MVCPVGRLFVCSSLSSSSPSSPCLCVVSRLLFVVPCVCACVRLTPKYRSYSYKVCSHKLRDSSSKACLPRSWRARSCRSIRALYRNRLVGCCACGSGIPGERTSKQIATMTMTNKSKNEQEAKGKSDRAEHRQVASTLACRINAVHFVTSNRGE